MQEEKPEKKTRYESQKPKIEKKTGKTKNPEKSKKN